MATEPWKARTGVIPAGTTLDTLTHAQWRTASLAEREAFTRHWARNGWASFVCLTCGMPSYRGVASCPACKEDE